jgi:hypothetical protein
MTASKSAPKAEKTSYLDEFYAANGKRGFEYLEEVKLSGNREKDRDAVKAAILEQARVVQTDSPILDESGERGFISAEILTADSESAAEQGDASRAAEGN